MVKSLWNIYARYDQVKEPKRFALFMLFVCLPIAIAIGAFNAGWYNLFLACALYSVTLLCTRMYWVHGMDAKKGENR